MTISPLRKASYLFVVSALALSFASDLCTPFITILFSYLALINLNRVCKRKYLSILLFCVLVLGVINAFVYFGRQAVTTIPHIISTSVPALLTYAETNGYMKMLPFDDVESMKTAIIDGAKGELAYFANFAKVATKEFVLLIIGLVIACSMFARPELDLDRGKHQIVNNLYTRFCDEISLRFRNFYESFSTVMGAQIVISMINTLFTGVFVAAVGMPHAAIIIIITFLCGLLPIIGNLMSNTVIVGVGITVGPRLAALSLVFLVVLHKFEYFLNSKIIGGRIRNPMWLTLLGLVVGEKLAGIPGMILAPVILHYLKIEARQIEVGTE